MLRESTLRSRLRSALKLTFFTSSISRSRIVRRILVSILIETEVLSCARGLGDRGDSFRSWGALGQNDRCVHCSEVF